MKRMYRGLLCTLVLSLVSLSTVFPAIPSVISYQGRLTDALGEPSAEGTANLVFSMYDNATGGTLLWTETHPGVTLSGGLFSVFLGSLTPLTDSLLAGPGRWLEISVNGEAITPRTQIGASPFAYRVGTVDGAMAGVMTGDLTLLNPDYFPQKDAMAPASIIKLGFLDGAGSISLYDPVDSKSGSSDPVKRVTILNDGIVMFGATEDDTTLIVAPNGDIIAKGQITMGENSSPGIQTSVLGFQNTANGDSSTIGGGSSNVTYGAMSVVAGGHENTAGGDGSTVSGGRHNEALGGYAVVAGGEENSATGPHAVVSGGLDNAAAGAFGVVPGGNLNQADGEYSHAAGRRAKALHDGSFVWADHTDEDFATTAPDQFIIRAKGGVGIGTNNPSGALEIVSELGDSAVILPNNAIGSDELQNESGLAGTFSSQTIFLTQCGPMQTLTSVTITIPAAGYILLSGTSTLEAYGSNSRNQSIMQIDEAEGGSYTAPFYAVTGSGNYDSPSRRHYYSMAVQRIYTKEAGTYTFYLEAQPHPQNGGDGRTNMMNPTLTATYIPSAYGAITVQSGLFRAIE